jgi:hypothetical protein
MSTTHAAAWAAVQALWIGLGWLCWHLSREYTVAALESRENWFWILLKFTVAVFLIGGLGYASASGMLCDLEDACYYQDFTGRDPEGAFYRWMFLAVFLCGYGIISGYRWFNDPLNPRGRYAKSGPAGT